MTQTSHDSARTAYDILIVGGGMVGLALAIDSARQGLATLVVEQELPEPETPVAGVYSPRVSAISRQSRDWLTAMGVWQHLPAKRPCAYHEMKVWDRLGQGRIGFHADEVQADNLGHIIENRWLISALWHQAEHTPGLTVLAGRTVQHWSLQGEQVQARLSDDTTATASVLAACDGRFSTIRREAGMATREWDYQQKAIVTTVRHRQPHRGVAHQVFLDTGPLAFLPLQDETGDQQASSIVWSVDNDAVQTLLDLPKADFLTALNRAFENTLGELTDCDPRFSFPLQQMHSKHYIAPRLALVGDAAHALHPLAGQGVNLGFQDAAALAAEWHRAHQRGEDPGSERTLRRYQRQRQGHNLAAMAAMEGFKRLYGSDNPLAVLGRNWGMSQLNRLPLVKRPLISTALGRPRAS
ncbi:UbiH/UbiF/VisC/COQ6 family ubiquinone biosynthesis hydroxylase [Saccharospirillum impatiens]|uniref:UbiH/UbiF/VisC/COQ6 family ubiquinone biosynthesis hydroxylase n=1 Tax=Saccharospirillum impatiens TaxID=169438 RepID=UPI0003FFE1BF|nr:UbiH/UbiF/VisC/COQ6 family ubiquinone biosynthesis hydroxylase [Saccharospirillum impatiens]